MNDQRTSHLSLPLPGNSLEVDLPRIQQAFITLDEKIASLDLLLTSDDLSLDTLQEMVTAIKAARKDVGAINAVVAEQLSAQNTAINSQLTDQNAQVAQKLQALSALVYAGL